MFYENTGLDDVLNKIDGDVASLPDDQRLKERIKRSISAFFDDFKTNTLAQLLGQQPQAGNAGATAQPQPQQGAPVTPSNGQATPNTASPGTNSYSTPQTNAAAASASTSTTPTGTNPTAPAAGGGLPKAKGFLGKLLWNTPMGLARRAWQRGKDILGKAWRGDYLDHNTWRHLDAMMESVYLEVDLNAAQVIDGFRDRLLAHIDKIFQGQQGAPSNTAPQTPSGQTAQAAPGGAGSGPNPVPGADQTTVDPRDPNAPPQTPQAPAGTAPAKRGAPPARNYDRATFEQKVRNGEYVDNMAIRHHAASDFGLSSKGNVLDILNQIRSKIDPSLQPLAELPKAGMSNDELTGLKGLTEQQLARRGPKFLRRLAGLLNIEVARMRGNIRGDDANPDKQEYYKVVVPKAIWTRLQEPGVFENLQKGISPQPVVKASDLAKTEEPAEGEALPTMGGEEAPAGQPSVAGSTNTAAPTAAQGAAPAPNFDDILKNITGAGSTGTAPAHDQTPVEAPRAPGEPVQEPQSQVTGNDPEHQAAPPAPEPTPAPQPQPVKASTGLGGRAHKKPGTAPGSTPPIPPEAMESIKSASANFASIFNNDISALKNAGLPTDDQFTSDQIQKIVIDKYKDGMTEDDMGQEAYQALFPAIVQKIANFKKVDFNTAAAEMENILNGGGSGGNPTPAAS